MSDLAPFVAATLRDKVMADLVEENEKLRRELRQHRKEWHVRIQSTTPDDNSGEAPVVYATGIVRLHDIVEGLVGEEEDEERGNVWEAITIPMAAVEGVEPCRVSACLDSTIVVSTEGGGDVMSRVIGMPTADTGGGIIAQNGQVEIQWYFFAGGGAFCALQMAADIPLARIPTISDALAAGLGVSRDTAFEVTQEITEDGPIRFFEMSLYTRTLMALSGGDQPTAGSTAAMMVDDD